MNKEIEKKIQKMSAEGIKELQVIQGSKEINKDELVRDLALSLIAKIQKLWDAGDKKEAIDYRDIMLYPIVAVIDAARKTNKDIFEMKYGKKIVTEKRGGFEEELEKMIDITPEEENGQSDKGEVNTKSV